jgi:transposase
MPVERVAVADAVGRWQASLGKATSYELLQRFRRLIARRGMRDLIQWLVDAAESGLRPFVSLAVAFRRITPRSSTD